MKSLLVLVLVLVLLPLATASQTNTLVVPGKSVGPVGLEMSLDQIKDILGEAACTPTKAVHANVPNSPEVDATLCQWGNRTAPLIYVVVADISGKPIFIDRYVSDEIPWKTVDGLQFGAEQTEAMRIYGQPERFWSEEWGNLKLFRIRFANGLRVGLFNDPMSHFHRRVISLGVWRLF